MVLLRPCMKLVKEHTVVRAGCCCADIFVARGDRRSFLEWQAEAGALLRNPPPDPDVAQRLDLRHQHVVTIDDADTRGAPANSPSGVADSARLVECVLFCDTHHILFTFCFIITPMRGGG